MSCAEIQHPPVARIHSKTLPIASPIFVPAELEGHICTLKGSPAIVGAENRSVRRARVGVGSAGQVDAARIGRVEGDRLDPHQVHVLVRHPIQHRLPATGRGIPPVRSAHVSPRIAQVLHRRMKDHTIHEAATYDLNILPTVLDRTRRLSHGGHCTKQNRTQGEVHFHHLPRRSTLGSHTDAAWATLLQKGLLDAPLLANLARIECDLSPTMFDWDRKVPSPRFSGSPPCTLRSIFSQRPRTSTARKQQKISMLWRLCRSCRVFGTYFASCGLKSIQVI